MTVSQVRIEQLDIGSEVGEVSICRHERVDFHRAIESVVYFPRVACNSHGGDWRPGR